MFGFGKGKGTGETTAFATFLARMTEEDRRLVRLASLGFSARAGRASPGQAPLTALDAFDLCSVKLHAARAGEPSAQRSFAELVGEGYELERDAALPVFLGSLSHAQRFEISTLAWFGMRKGEDEHEAFVQAVRTCYDRERHFDPEVRSRSSALLGTLRELVEVNAQMKAAVQGFLEKHLARHVP